METKMKAIILDGGFNENALLRDVTATAENCLRTNRYNVETIILRKLTIAACKGCFDCWMKTPGICGIGDAGRDIAEKIIKSNLLVLVTPVTFGGYSSEIKKIQDRMIPLISPHFINIYGETHHKARYPGYPDIAGIGILPERDSKSEEIFKTLARRNAMQHSGVKFSSTVITEKQCKEEIESCINELLTNMEAPSA